MTALPRKLARALSRTSANGRHETDMAPTLGDARCVAFGLLSTSAQPESKRQALDAGIKCSNHAMQGAQSFALVPRSRISIFFQNIPERQKYFRFDGPRDSARKLAIARLKLISLEGRFSRRNVDVAHRYFSDDTWTWHA
jgi:hypothetical protein